MIIKQFPETIDSKTLYQMTRGQGIGKMRDAKGQQLRVVAYVLREEANVSDGEVSRILTIRDESGDLYATNSKPFVREFEAVLDCNPAFPLDIEVIGGRSKAGREYLTMAWK